MKFDKGMWLDGKPNQNPIGTTRVSKNLVYDYSRGAFINENGQVYIDGFGATKRPIGFITLDANEFIVFSKRNADDSAIGIVNEALQYRELTAGLALGFKYTHPIHGEFQRTPNGERVIVFTDNLNPFRYYNIDRNTTADNMEIFPDYTPPKLKTDILVGGNLTTGAWYPIFSYEKDDRTTTSWIKHYNPVFISGIGNKIGGQGIDERAGTLPNTPTNLAITMAISGMDTRFKRLRIGLVSVINGIKTAFYVKTIDTSTITVNLVLASMEEMTPLTLDEVIIDKVKYKAIEHVTQRENILYAAGVKTFQEPIQQAKTSAIELQWTSQLVDFGFKDSFKDHNYNNLIRHFQHGEVYAIYIRFRYHWGWGQWWHIPGRTIRSGEDEWMGDFRRYQLYDTCSVDGTLSYWHNEDERYPNKDYYPSNYVRHIKFPSIRWMKQNVYASDNTYGSSKLDILNLKIKPGTFNLDDYKDCNGTTALDYQIGYAERGEGEGIVAGQSFFLGSSDWVRNSEKVYTSMGMNTTFTNPSDDTNNLTLSTQKIRTYDYTMLFNNRATPINYVRSELQLYDTLNLTAQKDYAYDYNNVRRGVARYYNNAASVPTQNITRVNATTFVINNTVLGSVDNTFLENTIVLDLAEPLLLPEVTDFTGAVWSVAYQYSHLLSLLTVKRNCYMNFTEQKVIVSDERKEFNLFGGDTYINASSITVFGTTSQRKYNTDPAQSADSNTPVNGTRIAHAFLSESKFNIGFRYVNPATQAGSTKFFPYNPWPEYLPRLRRDQEPNALSQGYSTDFNVQNNLDTSLVWNHIADENQLEQLPFIAMRGQSLTNINTFDPWIDFRINDLYYLDRTKGRLVNFTSNKDYLIFHHERALMVTRTTNYMDASGQEVFVGTGNIFAHPPIEIVTDKLGGLGTQHKWSCLVTPYGYVFLDADKGQLVLFNGQINIISEAGMRNFFLKNSFNPGDNPFMYNGWHTSFDERNKRFLITKKHKKLSEDLQKRYKGVWRNDKNFLNSLKVGDIVYKDGQYQFVQPPQA